MRPDGRLDGADVQVGVRQLTQAESGRKQRPARQRKTRGASEGRAARINRECRPPEDESWRARGRPPARNPISSPFGPFGSARRCSRAARQPKQLRSPARPTFVIVAPIEASADWSALVGGAFLAGFESGLAGLHVCQVSSSRSLTHWLSDSPTRRVADLPTCRPPRARARRQSKPGSQLIAYAN